METEESDIGEHERLRAESIQIVRDLILKGNPDLVPDLVQGETLAELMASIEPARAAYGRIAESIRSEREATPALVPAGGTSARIDLDSLTADGLIKRGLAQLRRGT
jgi:hypothetical protein